MLESKHFQDRVQSACMDHLIESEYQQVIIFWFCVWINKNNNETKVFIIQLSKIEPFLFQTVTIVDHGFKLNKQKEKKSFPL